MAMPVHVPDPDWTVERALALPDDGNRHEVLDGELFVTPSPSWGHQAVLDALYARVREHVRAHRLGWTRWWGRDRRSHRSRLRDRRYSHRCVS